MKTNKYSCLFVLLCASFYVFGQNEDFRRQAPEPGPAPELQLGDFKDFKLDNGLTVIVVENHKLPRVSFQLYVDRPILLEGEYAGTGDVMGQLLRSGTESRTKAQIDEAIDFIGATITTNSNGATARGLSRHAETLISTLADCVLNPAFPEEEFEKVIKQNESGLAFQKDDPEVIAENVANQVRFGKDHPYGERMTEWSLAKITPQACRNFYKRYFRPQISYLVVVGDILPKQARYLADTYFGSWESEGKLFTEFFDYPQAPQDRVVNFVGRTAAVQSVINVTYPVRLKPGSKDAITAHLLNQILGGGSNGRLFRNLREDKAYTYGAYSDLESDPNIGFFNAYANVRNEVTDSAVQEILTEMNRLRTTLVSAAELQEAKSLITGDFARSLEQPEAIARFALNTIRYKLPRNYYPTYLENLSKVSAADVLEIAQDFLLPDRAHLVIVGDKQISESLKRFAANKAVHYYNPGGEQQDMAGMISMEGITAEEVIAKYIQAIGGQERILEISDLATVMGGEVQGMQMTMSQEKKRGGKMHLTVSMSGMKVNEATVNGKAAKLLQMGAEQPMDEATRADLREQAHIFPEAQFEELGYTLEMNGTEVIDDKNTYVLQITSPAGKKVIEYYDTITGLKVRTLTRSEEATVTVDYGDYREVEGLLYPHKVISSGLMPVPLILELKSLAVNTGLSENLFDVK